MGEVLRYKDFLKTYKTRGHRLNHLKNYKKYFPIKANPVLAGIVADLICDGHLQGGPIWRADFTSKSKEELGAFEKRLNKLFKIKCKIRECKSNKYGKTFNLGINCSPLARIFLLCGVPSGEKVLKDFPVPNWIKRDKNCFREFCRRMFTCEGSIMNDGRKIPQIRLEMWKSEKNFKSGRIFIADVCKLLENYFNIKSTITFPKSKCVRKDKVITKKIKVYIMGQAVLNFYKEVGFDNSKQQTLKALLANNS